MTDCPKLTGWKDYILVFVISISIWEFMKWIF